MEERKIGFFDKYLTLWVLLCIVAGIAVGKFLPAIPQILSLVRIVKSTRGRFS